MSDPTCQFQFQVTIFPKKQLWRFFGKMFLPFLFVLLLRSGAVNASQTIYSNQMPPSKFWTDIHPIGTIEYHSYLGDSSNKTSPLSYHLYRDKEDDWYLMGNGNGQLWRLDSNRIWVRLDKTVFLGYDYSSYVLFHGLKYGGYGLWRTNGMLYSYREKVGEWELIPLSRELPIYGQYCFYDFRRNTLIQSGACIVNNSFKKDPTIIDSLFELDLTNRDWVAVGRLNPDANFFTNPAGSLKALETMDGKWMYSYAGDTCAYLDFIRKKCHIPNKSVQNTFIHLYEKVKEGKSVLVSTETAILVLDTTDFTITDSLTWKEILKDPYKITPLLQEANQESIFSAKNVLLTTLGLSLLIPTILIVKRKRYKRSPQKIKDEQLNPAAKVIDAFLLVDQNNKLEFNGHDLSKTLQSQEVLLLRALVEMKLKGEVLNTIQFNELIGIDNRTPDNQKKIRSELLKSLNLRFQYLGFPYEAVSRVRHSEDRRMMVYFLHEKIKVNHLS